MVATEEMALPLLDVVGSVAVTGEGSWVVCMGLAALCAFVDLTVEGPMVSWESACLGVCPIQVGLDPMDFGHFVKRRGYGDPKVLVAAPGAAILLKVQYAVADKMVVYTKDQPGWDSAEDVEDCLDLCALRRLAGPDNSAPWTGG